MTDWSGNWLAPLVVFLIFLLAGIILRTVFVAILTPLVNRSSHELPKIFLNSIRGYIPVWFILAGIGVAAHLLPLTPTALDYVDKTVVVLLVFSAAFPAARIFSSLFMHLAGQVERVAPLSGMVTRVVQVIIWAVAILTILSYLGIGIAPALTTLGLGGLAAALALQDTLANFFAGFYILADRPVRVGDYIKLDPVGEGYVVDVGWRSSRIRTLANNLVVIPNQKLAQSVITNYSLPETRMAASIVVRTDYDVELEAVEKALLDVANGAIGEVPGLLADPAPSVRLAPGFGDYGLEFSLNFQVAEYVDQYLIQHELRKRILVSFRHAGIRMASLSMPDDSSPRGGNFPPKGKPQRST